jgi:hypothetical protein
MQWKNYPLFTLFFIGLIFHQSVWPVLGSHFRGAIISWKPVNSLNFNGMIEITHRVAWRRSLQTHHCESSTISQQTLLSGEGSLACTVGCSGTLGAMSYYCTDFSEAEDWTVGERTYLANVGLQTTRFEASFASGAWIRLNVGGGGWEVRVKGDLSIRADLGRINTSPVTATQPIVRIQSNCPTAITIPVEDADGDVVKCRWAEGSQSECSGVCMAFPHATLDEVSRSHECQ